MAKALYRCSRCGEDKEAERFHKNPQSKTGLYRHCKPCRAVSRRERLLAASPNYRPQGSTVPAASKSPTVAELYWAAGFLEGEGTFPPRKKSRDGIQVACGQVQREPLERLQAMFGGNIRLSRRSSPRQDIYWWWVNGARARGVLLTLYGLMSPRRQWQFRMALEVK